MKKNTQMLVVMSLMTALEIILSRFLSISAWNMKIGFSFVPIALTAILYGALPAGIVAGVADFLGAILFPIGAYFPGFTLTAFLTGCILGLFLHKKQSVVRIVAAVVINQFILGLFMNTFWISVLYGSPFRELFAVRIVQSVILTAVQVAGILAIRQILANVSRKSVLAS